MLRVTNSNRIYKAVSHKLICIIVFVLSISYSMPIIAQQKLTNKEAEEKRDEADKYFKKLQYLQALDLYKQVEKFYSKSAILNFRMGVCYLKTSEKKKALAYLNNSAKMGQRDIDYIDPNYCYGRAYHYLHDFDNAIKSYKTYLSVLDSDKDAKEITKIRRLIQMCDNGKKLVAQKLTNVKIDHLDTTVNSTYPDISPVISLHNDTLLFASRRVDILEKKPNKETNEYSENIYISCWKSNDWVPAVPLLGMNSNRDEAPLSFSWDGKKLFVYKTERNGEKNTWQFPYEDSTGRAEKMAIRGDGGNNEQGGSLSPDGKRFYFSSDRPGGQGGMDIYYMEKKGDEWAEPVNMGSTINTPYNDISPYMFADGKTFYFSSEGHNSMGETDLFVAKLQNNGSWAAPQNMGYPINSAEEEPSICFTADGKTAYFASIREDSYGFDDIYKVTFGVAAPVAATATHAKDTVKHVVHSAAPKMPLKGDILEERVNFANNSASIPDEAKNNIDQVVTLMKAHPGIKLIVSGYPSAPITPESDPKITEERVQAVISYMVAKGVGKDRLYAKVYTHESAAAGKEKGKYRLVEFVVMMVNSPTAQKGAAVQPPKSNLMKD